MSLDAVYHEQQRVRCACVRLSSKDCLRARYNREDVYDDERCECACHDGEYADENEA